MLAGNVSGTIFEDLDADAVVDQGEGLSGWAVYADLNNNGTRDSTEPQTTSSTTGSYYLGNLTAGSVVLRGIAPAGWQMVDASRTVTVFDNTTQLNQNLRGALTTGAVLTGSIWHDINGNGTRDSGETMSTSPTVYVDLDNDSVQDAGEPVTTATTSNGGVTYTYRLAVAQAGTYAVRQRLTSPWQQVLPAGNAGQTVTVTAGERVTLADFVDRNPFVTISGTVFEDPNGNAFKDTGENTVLLGWRVYADLNDNGSPDSNEPAATTNSYGAYSLTVDTQGTLSSVSVRTVVPTGWVPTGATGNRRLVSSLKGGSSYFNVVFGNQTTGGLVSGFVWNDTNGDAVKASNEGVVSGRTVYADLDDDASLDADEPQVTTASDGTYQLLITTAGTFNVRQVVPTGWAQTSPLANVAQSVTVTLGTLGTGTTAAVPGSRITGRNFGVRSTSYTLSGIVFDDADSNGSKGTSEALLSGWRVFADLNDNGVFDAAEPSSVTSASGAYAVTLTSLTGSASVKFRVEVQAGWQATLPSGGVGTMTVSPGGSFSAANYGVKVLARGIAGTVWNDADADGTKGAAEAGLGGWLVYIDANANGVRDAGETSTSTGSDGSYVLLVPAAGDYVVRQVPMSNWLPTAPATAARTVTVGSTRVSGMNFGYRSTLGYVSGTVYDDANANGAADVGEAGLAGWRVYADLNNNGLFDGTEPSTTSSSTGTYALGIQASTGSLAVKVRTVAASGWTTSSPTGGVHDLTVLGGQTLASRNFGNAPTGALVSGLAWNDVNGDGVRDAAESGYFGWTIFADANNNALLDAGEARTTTLSGGVYQLVVPTAGSYTIRPVTDSFWVTTAPAGGGYAVTVGLTDRVTGRDFGRQAAIGYVSGTVYNDADASGGRNGTEAGLAGWRVFVDVNGNGLLDASEPSTLTSSSGSYGLSVMLSSPSLATTVRTQIQPGWVGTSPATGAQAVTIARGQTASARDFGVQADATVAVISGIAFNDVNGNGLRDSADATLSGRTIYVDADGDGALDTDEVRTITGSDGTYRLPFGTAGAYTLRQVLPAGFAQTAPAGDAGIAVTVAIGDRATGRDFGSRSVVGGIAGVVFNDADGDGIQDSGESGLSGWRVYVDVNGNDAWDATEPSATTASSGSYFLGNIVATQTPVAVRTVIPAGWAATLPSGGEQAVTVVIGSTVTGRNFGNRSTLAAATGTLWNDSDADGERDTGEAALSGRPVYVDADGDGVMDADEVRAYTAADGTYRLTLPSAGTYTVRQLLPAGWLQTSPATGAARTVVIAAAGDVSAGNDFGSRSTVGQIAGVVFNDVNSNGIADAGESAANVQVYADLDGDDTYDAGEPSYLTASSGSYVLAVSTVDPTDPAAVSRSIGVRILPPAGWVPLMPASGERSVTVTGGQIASGQNFTLRLAGASVTGLVFNDVDGDGAKGSIETGLAQMTVFIDANDNGVLESSETRATTGADGSYRLLLPAAGSYVIRAVSSGTWIATSPVPFSYSLTVVGGESLTAKNFGLRASSGTVAGTVYDDADQSGSRETGEIGLAGWRVYADLDDDGVADADEPATSTSTSGGYTLQIPTTVAATRTVKLRTIAPAGWAASADGVRTGVTVTGGQQTPGQDFGARLTGTLVSGLAWNDLNGNGTREAGDAAVSGRIVYADLDGDSLLDANEPRATTGADGSYRLLLTTNGTYTVRQSLPAYWVQTTPVGGHAATVDSSGVRLTGRDFGSRYTAATVSGVVFEDLDGDGVRDSGEAGLAGIRVYADTNDDGTFTTGEPSFTTSSSGSYFLTVPNLATAATVKIRQASSVGWAATVPVDGLRALQLSGGQTVSGVDFGNRLSGAIVAGVVWNDLDSDGIRDTGEAALSGRTVYVDANDNAVLDAAELRTTTLADGSYQFMLTAAGSATIRTVLPTGWQATLPAAAVQTVAVTLGNRYAGRDFGTRLTTGSVSGVVFNDLDGDGVQDTGEAGLGGWVVFIDANSNGVLDTNEARTSTTSTGAYVFQGVTEGMAAIRLQLQAGWSFTVPGTGLLSVDVVAGRTISGKSFGVCVTPAQS